MLIAMCRTKVLCLGSMFRSYMASAFILCVWLQSGCVSCSSWSKEEWRVVDDYSKSVLRPFSDCRCALGTVAISTDIPVALTGDCFETFCSNRLDTILGVSSVFWRRPDPVNEKRGSQVSADVLLGVWLQLDSGYKFTKSGFVETVDCRLIVSSAQGSEEPDLMLSEGFSVLRPWWILAEGEVCGGDGIFSPGEFGGVIDEVLNETARRIDDALRISFPLVGRIVRQQGRNRFVVARGRRQGIQIGDTVFVLSENGVAKTLAVARGMVSEVLSGSCAIDIKEWRCVDPANFLSGTGKQDHDVLSRGLWALFMRKD